MKAQVDKLYHHRYGDDVSLSPCIFGQSARTWKASTSNYSPMRANSLRAWPSSF